MAPGFLNAHPDDHYGKMWRRGCRVRLDDIWQTTAVAWDEAAGQVIVQESRMNGEKLPMQLKTGRVTVSPR